MLFGELFKLSLFVIQGTMGVNGAKTCVFVFDLMANIANFLYRKMHWLHHCWQRLKIGLTDNNDINVRWFIIRLWHEILEIVPGYVTIPHRTTCPAKMINSSDGSTRLDYDIKWPATFQLRALITDVITPQISDTANYYVKLYFSIWGRTTCLFEHAVIVCWKFGGKIQIITCMQLRVVLAFKGE